DHRLSQPRCAAVPLRRAVEGRGGASEAVEPGGPTAGVAAGARGDSEDPQDASVSGDITGPGADRGDPGDAGGGGRQAGRSRMRPRRKTMPENGLENRARRTRFSKLVVQKD